MFSNGEVVYLEAMGLKKLQAVEKHMSISTVPNGKGNLESGVVVRSGCAIVKP